MSRRNRDQPPHAASRAAHTRARRRLHRVAGRHGTPTDTWSADPDDLTELALSTSEPHLEVDDIAWVRWRLEGLPPREREVVTCLEVVGLGVAATAAALDLSSTARASYGIS